MSNEVTISSNFHSLTGKITMSGHLRVNESYAVAGLYQIHKIERCHAQSGPVERVY